MNNPNKLVSKRQLREELGIPYSFQHIARLEAAGKFPKRIRLGQGRVAWVQSEVEDWIADKVRARDAEMAEGASSF